MLPVIKDELQPDLYLSKSHPTSIKMWASRGTEFNLFEGEDKTIHSLGYEDSEVPFKPCDHLAGLDIGEYDSWKGTSMLESGLIGPHFLLSTSVKITHRSCLFLLCRRFKREEGVWGRRGVEKSWMFSKHNGAFLPSLRHLNFQGVCVLITRARVSLLLLNWHVAANYSRSAVVGYGYK